MGNSIWGPYGAHIDVPRWVPDESLLQNPHRSHMGCQYRSHIITHLGPNGPHILCLLGCWYFSHEPSSLFHHSVLVDLNVSVMVH